MSIQIWEIDPVIITSNGIMHTLYDILPISMYHRSTYLLTNRCIRLHCITGTVLKTPGVECVFCIILNFELTLQKSTLNFWLDYEISLKLETALHPRTPPCIIIIWLSFYILYWWCWWCEIYRPGFPCKRFSTTWIISPCMRSPADTQI